MTTHDLKFRTLTLVNLVESLIRNAIWPDVPVALERFPSSRTLYLVLEFILYKNILVITICVYSEGSDAYRMLAICPNENP